MSAAIPFDFPPPRPDYWSPEQAAARAAHLLARFDELETPRWSERFIERHIEQVLKGLQCWPGGERLSLNKKGRDTCPLREAAYRLDRLTRYIEAVNELEQLGEALGEEVIEEALDELASMEHERVTRAVDGLVARAFRKQRSEEAPLCTEFYLAYLREPNHGDPTGLEESESKRDCYQGERFVRFNEELSRARGAASVLSLARGIALDSRPWANYFRAMAPLEEGVCWPTSEEEVTEDVDLVYLAHMARLYAHPDYRHWREHVEALHLFKLAEFAEFGPLDEERYGPHLDTLFLLDAYRKMLEALHDVHRELLGASGAKSTLTAEHWHHAPFNPALMATLFQDLSDRALEVASTRLPLANQVLRLFMGVTRGAEPRPLAERYSELPIETLEHFLVTFIRHRGSPLEPLAWRRYLATLAPAPLPLTLVRV